jgi:hypothetical protein
MPTVLNKYKHGFPPGSVYIGRPSKWGNPFAISATCTREQSVAKFREWVKTQPELISQAKTELRGCDLVCFCSPKECHGDVWLEIANE